MDRRWGYGTDRRLQHENADAAGIFTFGAYTLAVVCDGTGGYHGGSHASALAVRAVYDAFASHPLFGLPTLGERPRATGPIPAPAVREALVTAIRRANNAVYDAARRTHRLSGIATTIAAALVGPESAFIAHVGHSRVYLLRGDSVTSLTRDHTMVNLFVAANLLSNEDAASHPEAGVLARSIGVERSVDIDIQEDIPLEYGDVVLLTTHGVHAVLGERELGSLDWANPTEAVENALDMVAAQEGYDNATICAVIVGEFDGPPSEVTPPPIIEAVDDASTAYQPGEMPTPPLPDPVGALVDLSSTPSPAPAKVSGPPKPAPTAEPPPVRAELEPVTAAAAAVTVPALVEPKPVTQAPPAEAKKPAAPPSARRWWIPALIGAVGAPAAVSLVVLAMYQRFEPPLPLDPPTATPADAQRPPEPAENAAAPPPAPASRAALAGDADPATALFSGLLPPTTARPPHRPTQFIAPPPGGIRQVRAIQYARNQECAKSLHEMFRLASESADYASLYVQPWDCFTKADQQPLLNTRATTLDEIAKLMPYFEGRADPARTAWATPTDGLDLRVVAYQESTDADLMRDAIEDRLGPGKVADELATDVYLSARLAAGIAEHAASDPAATTWWARRLYRVVRARQSVVGRLIESEAPEMTARIDALVVRATLGEPLEAALDPKHDTKLPKSVMEAWRAGLGVEAPAAPPKPVAPKSSKRREKPAPPPDPNAEIKLYRPPKLNP